MKIASVKKDIFSHFISSIYRMRSSAILGLSLGLHSITPMQQTFGVLNGCVRRIKVCLIPEIFCIVYRQKSIVSKKEL